MLIWNQLLQSNLTGTEDKVNDPGAAQRNSLQSETRLAKLTIRLRRGNGPTVFMLIV